MILRRLLWDTDVKKLVMNVVKKLNASDVTFHDANGTLCEGCFVSKVIFDALKNIKEKMEE